MAKYSTEYTRKFRDKVKSIDEQLDEANANINWERRNFAEQSLVNWVKTYCIGLFIDDAPPPLGENVLNKMQWSVENHNNYMICLPRGSGKSCYAECAALYGICTGKQKYIVVVAASASRAGSMLNDIKKVVTEQQTLLAEDYPDVFLPYHLKGNSFRRAQLYQGTDTDFSCNASRIIFPRIKRDGKDVATSHSIVETAGISASFRGMKYGTQRPTMVILDDLQTDEVARSIDQVDKIHEKIKKDIMGLAGKERLSILQTATPILPDDLVERIKNDKGWTHDIFKAIIAYPKNKSLWKEYLTLREQEHILGKKNTSSLKFYKEHFDEMNAGAEVFNPFRFSKEDGHISAIQKLIEIEHDIGKEAFASEYQMQPHKSNAALEITPSDVIKKNGTLTRAANPDGYQRIIASSDLNLSYGITTVIVGFKADQSAVILYHHITKTSIHFRALNENEYAAQTYKALEMVGNEIKNLNMKIDTWVIDGNGTPFDTVTTFNKVNHNFGFPTFCFVGQASTKFNGFPKNRLANAVNDTVMLGDSIEHVKSGQGKKWVYWNSDKYRFTCQRAMLTPLGLSGGLELYHADNVTEHAEFAKQFCNEQLKCTYKRYDGKEEYRWESREPHDYLDAVSQAYAAAGQLNISGQNTIKTINANSKPKIRPKRRGYVLV